MRKYIATNVYVSVCLWKWIYFIIRKLVNVAKVTGIYLPVCMILCMRCCAMFMLKGFIVRKCGMWHGSKIAVVGNERSARQ